MTSGSRDRAAASARDSVTGGRTNGKSHICRPLTRNTGRAKAMQVAAEHASVGQQTVQRRTVRFGSAGEGGASGNQPRRAASTRIYTLFQILVPVPRSHSVSRHWGLGGGPGGAGLTGGPEPGSSGRATLACLSPLISRQDTHLGWRGEKRKKNTVCARQGGE